MGLPRPDARRAGLLELADPGPTAGRSGVIISFYRFTVLGCRRFGATIGAALIVGATVRCPAGRSVRS